MFKKWKAIRTINSFKEQLKTIDRDKFEAWRDTCIETVNGYLGEEHSLSQRLLGWRIDFSGTAAFTGREDKPTITGAERTTEHRRQGDIIFNAIIDYIKANGVFEKEKVNILSSKTNIDILGYGIGLIIFGGSCVTIYYENIRFPKEEYELKEKLSKYENLSPMRTDSVSNQDSEKYRPKK